MKDIKFHELIQSQEHSSFIIEDKLETMQNDLKRNSSNISFDFASLLVSGLISFSLIRDNLLTNYLTTMFGIETTNGKEILITIIFIVFSFILIYCVFSALIFGVRNVCRLIKRIVKPPTHREYLTKLFYNKILNELLCANSLVREIESQGFSGNEKIYYYQAISIYKVVAQLIIDESFFERLPSNHRSLKISARLKKRNDKLIKNYKTLYSSINIYLFIEVLNLSLCTLDKIYAYFDFQNQNNDCKENEVMAKEIKDLQRKYNHIITSAKATKTEIQTEILGSMK